MEIDNEYLGKRVKIDLINGHYYEGVVLDISDKIFKLRDKFGKLVTLSPDSIILIQEVL